MKPLTNFVLGALLAAVLIIPQAWGDVGQAVRIGVSMAATEFGHAAPPAFVSNTVRSALMRTP